MSKRSVSHMLSDTAALQAALNSTAGELDELDLIEIMSCIPDAPHNIYSVDTLFTWMKSTDMLCEADVRSLYYLLQQIGVCDSSLQRYAQEFLGYRDSDKRQRMEEHVPMEY